MSKSQATPGSHPAERPEDDVPPVPEQDSDQRWLTQRLRERVKELTLLHGAARLLHGKAATDRDVLAELVRLLPPAWLHPKVCEARIAHGEIDVRTPGWEDGPWKLSSPIATANGHAGVVEVVYLEQQPEEDEGPFLNEERALLGSLAEMISTYLDHRHAERKAARLAYYEPVTGLPNRAFVTERLTTIVEAAADAGHAMALLLVNLSQFRDINNTLGHRNGDEVLRHVARVLRETLREEDLLASLGGDEFVILLPRLADRGTIDRVITDIEDALDQPTKVAGVPVKLEGSIGVALFPEHGDTGELLWQHADVALRVAKDTNRDHLLYSPQIDHYQPQRIALLGELPQAMADDQLVLHYQPKIDLKTGKTVWVEALVRWEHPSRGQIPPDSFIPLAERTQLINSLTRWVLKAALGEYRRWYGQGLQLGICVNLSARNLLDPQLCAEIPGIAEATGIPLERLVLEITESGVMADPERAKRALRDLSSQGVQFSIDDFGVGQSSLAYLKDLPASKVKIDKSFIIGLTEHRNHAIVRGMIELGHSLGLEVTAEGVEDDATRLALQELGCDLGQGYFFTKPLPAENMTQWMARSSWPVQRLGSPS